jgi:integrase
LILTAARSGEVRGATWEEVDLKAKVWTVPAGRMKAGTEHRVPLTDRALEILELVKPLTGGAGSIFPGAKRGQPMSDMVWKSLMKRMGVDGVTAHGFRSAFRDFAGDATTFPREVAEAALAHQVGNAVEQAYRRGDALAKRRELMQAWARYVDAESRILKFRSGGAAAEAVPS